MLSSSELSEEGYEESRRRRLEFLRLYVLGVDIGADVSR